MCLQNRPYRSQFTGDRKLEGPVGVWGGGGVIGHAVGPGGLIGSGPKDGGWAGWIRCCPGSMLAGASICYWKL